MSKANKAGHAKASSRKATAAGGPTSRRLNVRALIILAVVVVIVVPTFFAWKAIQGQAGRQDYLNEARRASDEGRFPFALQYITAYLQKNPDSLEGLELKGKILAQSARDNQGVEEAIKVQNQILARDPKRPGARKQVIELNLKAGLYRAAEAAAEQYLEAMGPDDAEAHRLMARALEGVGFIGNDNAVLDRAIAQYERAEELEPGDVDGGIRLAFLLRTKGRADRAEEQLKKLLERNPKSSAVRLARLRYYLTQPARGQSSGAENARNAADELDEALKLAPGDATVRTIAAELAVRRGETAAAAKHLDSIDPPPKNDLRVSLIRGMIQLREQKPDEAIESWRSGLVQTGGTDAELTWRLARILLSMGRVRDAKPLMAQYNRLVNGSSAEPKPEYRYLMALAYLQRGRAEEAKTELEAIREKIGRDLVGQHLVTLGAAYESLREDSKALDAYRRAAKLEGAGAQPWIAVARIQLAVDAAAAVKTLKEGLVSVPDDPTMLVLLARILLRREVAKPEARRDWKEFNGHLDHARALAPNSPEVAQLAAEHLAVSGRDEEGLALLKAATESSSSPGPWLARAGALGRLGRQAEAIAVLDEAVKKAGDNAAFRITRARFLIDLGQVSAARNVLRDGLDKLPQDQWPQLFRALGDYYFRNRNDYAAARGSYEEWLRQKPESHEPYLALIELARARGDDAEVEARLGEMKKALGPESLYWKIARAEHLLPARAKSPGNPSAEDAARLEEAEGLIKDLVSSAPNQPAGHILKARLAAIHDDPKLAIEEYNAALPLRGGQAALEPLVGLLAKGGRDEDLKKLRETYSAFTADLDRLAGEATLQTGDTEKAEAMARRVLQGSPESLDAAVWTARVLNTIGKSQEAEETLKVMTQQRPEDPNAWVRLLMLQVAHNDRAAARATVETMKQKVKYDRPDLLWATCYRVLGLRDLADGSFAEALRRWPDDVKVRQAAVDYYESTLRPELAERSLRHLLKVTPGLDWAKRRLALNLSGRRNDEAALAEAMALVKEDPKGGESPDERMLRAVVLSRSLDPARRAQAIAVLEGLAAEIPNSTRLHEYLARSYLEAKDRPRALEHAARAAGKDGGPEGAAAPTSEAIALYGALMLEDKDVAEAERQLARLLAVAPKAPATIDLNVRVLHARGDDKAAAAALRAAFDERKGGPEATAFGIVALNLLTALGLHDAAEVLGAEVAKLGARGQLAFAELLEHRGKSKEARALVESASKADAAAAARSSLAMASEKGDASEWIDQTDGLLKLALRGQPESLELLQAQAYLRHLQDSFDEEIKVYEAILAKNPKDRTFLNNYAWTLSENKNRPKEGLKWIEEAIKGVGWQPHLIDTRGVILIRLGRVEEGIKDLEAAVVALPTPTLFFHLARAYHKAGNTAGYEKYRDLARKAGLRREQLQKAERDEAEAMIGFPAAGPPASASASRS